MKQDIETLQEIVYKILKEKRATRDDDQLLHYLVLEHLGYAHRVKNGIFIPWKHISDHPAYESITRLRRKLQEEERNEKPPERWSIQSSKIIQGFREEQEQEMRYINQWWTPTRMLPFDKQTLLIPEDDDT